MFVTAVVEIDNIWIFTFCKVVEKYIWGVEASVTIVLLMQISCWWFRQWKNCENRLTFVKFMMNECRVSCFLTHSVYAKTDRQRYVNLMTLTFELWPHGYEWLVYSRRVETVPNSNIMQIPVLELWVCAGPVQTQNITVITHTNSVVTMNCPMKLYI